MALVEARDDLRHRVGRIEIDVPQRDVDLEDLLAVAHVHRPLDADRPRERLGRAAAGPRPPCRRTPGAAARPTRARVADVGPHRLVAEVRRQHPPGRQDGRDPRHDDAPDLEAPRDVGHVEGGRPAERQEREPPGIDATPHRDDADALGHHRVDDPVDALGRHHPVGAEPLRDRVHRCCAATRSSCVRPPRKLPGSR